MLKHVEVGRQGKCLRWRKIRTRITNHIQDEAGDLAGQLAEWDVINEPRANQDFMEVLGDEAMAEWFEAARVADPDAKLYVNDYGLLPGNERNIVANEGIVQFLLKQGAPLDGIGFQAHFTTLLPYPETVLAVLDRFGAFGLDMMVTEFDVNIRGAEAVQARFLKDFYTAVFSHPQAVSILMWGFWEGAHWKPNAAMFRRDWSIKPNGRAYQDLVFNEWWTNKTGRTGAHGNYTTRGFLGDYEIAVRKSGRSKAVAVALTAEGKTVDIVLDFAEVSE